MKRQWIVVLVLLVFIFGCSTQKEVPDTLAVTVEYNETYRIGMGDQLHVMVWRNPDLSVNLPVRPDGNISVPLVGDIKAINITAEALAASITKSLRRYIRSPEVTVIVTDASSAEYMNMVRVTGAVEGPMSIPHKKGMTVMDLVLMAGGVTIFSSPDKAKLYRTTGDGADIYPVYLNDILKKGELSTNYTLHPNDIITVPERMF